MGQPYNESILEVSLDINTSLVHDFEPSEGDPLNVLPQVANLPEEPMGSEMLPHLPHQPKPEPGPMKVSSAVCSDSELSIERLCTSSQQPSISGRVSFPNHGNTHLQLLQLSCYQPQEVLALVLHVKEQEN